MNLDKVQGCKDAEPHEWYEQNQILINQNQIFVNLPHYKIKKQGSCGAAALRSIGSYYGLGPQQESEWRLLLQTTADGGTSPKDIINTLRFLGLTARPRRHLHIEELQSIVAEGYPILCPIQAYAPSETYQINYNHYWNINCGHWVIVIGFDEKYIYLEDSFITGMRGFMTHNKFLNRWYDMDKFGKYYERYGIIVKSEDDPINEKILKWGQRIW